MALDSQYIWIFIWSSVPKCILQDGYCEVVRCEVFGVVSGNSSFHSTHSFRWRENRVHDLCNKTARTMNGGSSLDNWKQSWKLLLSKKYIWRCREYDFNIGYTTGELTNAKSSRLNRRWFTFHHYNGRLGLGRRGIRGIVDTRYGYGGREYSYWGLRYRDRKVGKLTQPISTPQKILRFKEERSILKELSVSKRKPIRLTQPYFRPRSNFRTMVFKTYLQLSILISIQNESKFGETETKLLVALTSIWKTLSSID